MAHNRLTVVSSVYHQDRISGEGTVSAESRYSVPLESDEQPYYRKLTVGSDWTPIDTGWLKDACGRIVLQNREGVRPQKIPTEAEVKELARRVLQIGLRIGDAVTPFAEVPPGEDAQIRPLDTSTWCVRAASGQVRCISYAFPK